MNEHQFPPTESQKRIAAEIKALAIGEAPRVLTPEYYLFKLSRPRQVGDLNICFWYGPGYKSRYLIIFRLDRRPEPAEFLPWAQLLLESKYAHSYTTEFSVEFMEGDIYLPDESLADKMANAITDYAEDKGDVST
jgi:hypothetical protein